MNQRKTGCIRLFLLGTLVLFSATAGATSHSMQTHHAPPPIPKEAYEVCQNLAEHDACSMTMPDGNVMDGTCEVAPPAHNEAASSATTTATGKLACRPSHMPPPPDGKGPDADEEQE